MKFFFVYLLFLNTLLYSQNREKTDSTAYYISLNYPAVHDNNYKEALLLIQKAILIAETNDNTKEQASQNYNLGKLYYDLKKYDDAIESLLRSSELYDRIKPSSKAIAANYTVGLCYMSKDNYDKATSYFDKAESIHTQLNLNDSAQLFNLQRGLIYKAKNNIELALPFFETIIALPNNAAISATKAEALYQTGCIETQKNRSNLALNYLNKALDINEKSENLEQRSDIIIPSKNWTTI